ncbi:MAG: winged helix-turn-helix transcriptional regulator [Candidatus Coatesbacteria bacterium]|nr:MAG: winged helix-turn-helix transcriptional regulator [Candidatus Coatesbacteria bacterium]
MDRYEIYELHCEVCKVIHHPVRMAVVHALGEGEKSVAELLERTDVSKANLSQHMKVLKNKGLVSARREGQKVFYSLKYPKILQALDKMYEVLLEMLADQGAIYEEIKNLY